MDEFGQRAPTPILCGCDVRRPWAGSYADRAPVMATCRSWLAGVSDASLAGQGRMRHASAALFGALGLLISIRSSVSASQPCEDDSQGPWCSTERATLAVSGLLSWYVAATPVPRLTPCVAQPSSPFLPHLTHFVLRPPSVCGSWCLGAAALALSRGGLLPRRPRRGVTALLLLRALSCGLLVAALGWLAAARDQRHLLLMAVMQANATVGAWGACAMQWGTARAKSPPPTSTGDLEDGAATAATAHSSNGSTHTRRAGSVTLPRGWRYHKSSGMFEHKRSGRMQWEPPSTSEIGSPLHADLPPCDEERGGCWDSGRECSPRTGSGGHRSDSDSGSDGWHGSNKGRSRRSRTWAYNSRSAPAAGHPTPPRHGRSGHASCSGMSVWELRDAMISDKGHGPYGPDAPALVEESPRRPPGGTGRARPSAHPSSHGGHPSAHAHGGNGGHAFDDYDPPMRKGRRHES